MYEPNVTDPKTTSHIGTIRPETLGSLFLHRCEALGEQSAYAVLADDLSIREAIAFRELRLQVAQVASWLDRFTNAGERVLLAFPAGLEFELVFWACLLTGRVAVPVPAPDPLRLHHAAPRLRSIIADSRAAAVLTTPGLLDAAAATLDAATLSMARWMALPPMATLAADDAEAVDRALLSSVARIPPSALAYLQYTSGSTSAPRGVRLTHANVLANALALQRGFKAEVGSRVLNWLPHFHDYGLVCGVIAPIVSGASTFLMSPIAFVRRPLRWLDAIERHSITHTGAPDSAFATCLQAAGDKPLAARLDSLVSLSCGAEPIRADTVERVMAVFGPAGLRPEALMCSYGLAEAVLGVTGGDRGWPPRIVDADAKALRDGRYVAATAGSSLQAAAPASGVGAGATRRLVGCGRPLAQTDLAVIDLDTERPVAAGSIGEIWVRSPSVGLGYWMQPEASEEIFDAFIDGAGGPYLRTGDLGFLDQGELFITGRSKDLVIVHGENHYPQDLEWSAERAHADLRPGHGVAFAVDGPAGESLVLVLEADRRVREPDVDAIFREVRRAIAVEHGLPLHAMALVRSGSLPRTSSGKLQRSRCRELFVEGRLALLAPVCSGEPSGSAAESETGAEAGDGRERPGTVAPRNATEQALWEVWSEVLGTRSFGVTDSFFDLGGNSLRMTQVVSRVNARFDIELPLGELLEHASIAALAAEVERHRGNDAGAASGLRLAGPVAVGRDKPLPVSLSQRRMWVIQHFEPASTAYNVPIAIRVRGAFDVDVCQRAFDLMVARHEGLRTHFVMGESEPLQRIEPTASVPIELIDLRPLPAQDRNRAARSLLAERLARSFDLAKAPLHQPTVIRLQDDEHVLFWHLHHAITDNWAGALLMREALAAYVALARGETHAPPPLDIQYADYAAWQRLPASVEARKPHLDYWRERLKDLPDLDLPTDFPRPARASFKGARVSAELPPRLRDALRTFGGREAVTPFVVLLSGFALMISRHAKSEDVAIGTPIANRHRLAAEGLVGTLVNTLVMRTDLSGDPSFTQLVHRVRKNALDAYAHQDAPYDELIDALGHDRTLRPEGPVRVLFNVLNAPVGQLDLNGLEVEEFDFERNAAQFDLSMHIDTEFSHRAHLEYASDLYSEVTASRMLENYLALLERLLGEPERPVSAHELLSNGQMALLRHAWNGATAPLPARLLVHRYVGLDDPQVADRIAAIGAEDGRAHTFADLDAASNRLARFLRERGVARGLRVGLCIDRSISMLVAQLGVMKSGAAYIPLDPAYPPDRLRYMAVDADLSFVLAQPTTRAIVDGLGVEVFDVEDLLIAQRASAEPLVPDAALDATPEDDAYLIYTSGSTGQPKGVKVQHRSVVNFLEGMVTMPGMASDDCLVAITSPSFDPSVLDLMLPLRVRARLVVASHAQAQDPFVLRALLEDHGATMLQATPSAWRLLIGTGWKGTPRFRALIGGEPLPPILAERLMERTGELWNIYGPTETTVWTTGWRVHSPREQIAIGKPIANTTVWVLDAEGHVCPIGVPGELHVGGYNVTPGYHRRAELTAEKFVPDPFSDEPDGRLYRTGDLGRWRHDGELEHMGRADHQVKLRGHRIEMGEIESALLDHPEVAHCVCITRAESEEDVRLVAYCVPVPGRRPTVAELRDHLRSRLPQYMIPQHFVLLETMPQLPNGKVNRAALPAPVIEAVLADGRSYLAPETPNEQAIARIWSGLLGVEQVGRMDNFFDLGGHSLLAMRAVTAIEEELGMKVLPRRLIYETLRQLAQPEPDVPASA
ncbi:Amino acid adenylation domain-containing protein [Burkholderiales bacterium 8X]|nr:Amino acid adenylation domain-containing protein [Burkholderiales bacterium 8X]